jgi:hypothetical protein
MDFSPGAIMVSLVVGGAGFVAFMYGKKQRRPPQLITGIVLMVFPYFVPRPLPCLAIGAGLLGVMWLAIHLGL